MQDKLSFFSDDEIEYLSKKKKDITSNIIQVGFSNIASSGLFKEIVYYFDYFDHVSFAAYCRRIHEDQYFRQVERRRVKKRYKKR